MEKKHKRVFAFDRVNFILLGIGAAVILLGMVLMSGGRSDTEHFNPDSYSTQHIRIAPLVCLFGYLFMIYAIMRRPRPQEGDK